MLFFFRKRTIFDQIDDFVEYKKGAAGHPAAVEHKERLMIFCEVVNPRDIQSLTLDDVYDFKGWLLDRFHGQYHVESHMHSVRCLLRFYRKYEILTQMTRLGRKPDYMAIARVKELRSLKPPKSYREIILDFKKREGRKVDKRQVNRWVHAKIS